MIYTSYYSNYRNFPNEYEPVSVSLYSPKGFKGKIVSELAPTNAILNDIKTGKIDEFEYINRYYDEVLSKLNPRQIASQLENKILLCFEKMGDFCHRHIIAKWLKDAGYEVKELNNTKERPVKIAVIGSRNFNDKKTAFMLLDRLSNKFNKNIEIVSGGANGADKIAEEYALYRGLEIKIYPAEWKKYGKSAGFIRNKIIWDNADLGIAFWDGKSKGTKHSFQISFQQNKDLYIWNDELRSFSPRIINGNILDHQNKYKMIIFTANSVLKNDNVLVMGAGCAKAFKKYYPNIDKDFGKKIKSLSKFGFEAIKKDNIWIGAFQTKINYKDKSSLELIEFSIQKLKDFISFNLSKKDKIAMCFPGVGLGELNEENVYKMFKGFGNLDLFLKKNN